MSQVQSTELSKITLTIFLRVNNYMKDIKGLLHYLFLKKSIFLKSQILLVDMCRNAIGNTILVRNLENRCKKA